MENSKGKLRKFSLKINKNGHLIIFANFSFLLEVLVNFTNFGKILVKQCKKEKIRKIGNKKFILWGAGAAPAT